MPDCASSACSSRRSSRGSCTSANYIMMNASCASGGSTSRRSSGGACAGSITRRDSCSYFVNPTEAMSPAVGANEANPAMGGAQAASNLLQSIGSGVVGAAAHSISTLTPPRYRKSILGRQFNPGF